MDRYTRPDTLDAALAALARPGARVAAGCTDLLAATEDKSLRGDIVDITGLAGLRSITRSDAGLRIGACVTWGDLLRHDLPPALDGLKAAASQVGARQVQNRATLAGNLCNASPAADGVPPLLTLDAQVEVTGQAGTRVLPLSDFIRGPRSTALARGDILTALLIPDASLTGTSAFEKLGARRYLVISIAMTAARLVIEDGIITRAALAIGACGPVATRLPAAEAALIGHAPNPNRIAEDHVAPALSPIDDIRADAQYRLRAATELVRRAVREAAP